MDSLSDVKIYKKMCRCNHELFPDSIQSTTEDGKGIRLEGRKALGNRGKGP